MLPRWRRLLPCWFALSLALLAAPGGGLQAAPGRGTPATPGLGSPAAAKPGHGAHAPTSEALLLAARVRARWMGVDHAGNLWAWEPLQGSVRFFSPSAEKLVVLTVPPETVALDGDAAWGALALTGEGAKLVWARPDGPPGSYEEVALGSAAGPGAGGAGSRPGSGGDSGGGAAAESGAGGPGGPGPWGWVCWIDADTFALAPQRAAHRVELWSLRRRKRLRSFGAEREIVLGPGVTRVREVQLRFDRSRRLLYTLESFTGELEVFSLDGALVRRARLPDPFQATEEKMLAGLDQRAKESNASLGQALSDLWLGGVADGSAWVAQQVEPRDGSVVLLEAGAAGSKVQRIAKLPCPSRTFTIWGRQLVFFRDIASPREVCNSVTPLP